MRSLCACYFRYLHVILLWMKGVGERIWPFAPQNTAPFGCPHTNKAHHINSVRLQDQAAEPGHTTWWLVPGSWHPGSSVPPGRASLHSSGGLVSSAPQPGGCAPARRACACTPAPASRSLENHLGVPQVSRIVLPVTCLGSVTSH